MPKQDDFVEITFPSSPSNKIRFLDLTQPIGPNIPQVGFPKFASSSFADYKKNGAYARMVTMVEHLGTHVDAPSHFVKGQINIDKVPFSQLIGPAAVFHIEKRVTENPDYRLNLEDVNEWERKNGKIPKGAIVLLATGWDKWWHSTDQSKYLNVDKNGNEHFPGICNEVFDFLVYKRDIKGVGVDCFRPEGGLGPPVVPGTRVPRHGHNVLCAAGKLIVENMRNLYFLPDTGALVILGVIPYENGSAGQARVIALLP